MRSWVVLALLVGGAPAWAGPLEDAKLHYERGLSAYALGNYPEAAAEYEKAFSFRPDPALLYNAAQAHRIAGNKPRALLLYQNYLRLFDNVSNRAEVERHIAQLKRAIETDKQSATSPPTEPVSPGKPLASDKIAPRPVAAPEPVPAAVAEPVVQRAAEPSRPVYKKGWFWGVMVGAAVVVGAGVGLGVGLGGAPANPEPTFGVARVQ
jgi:tetratricopeptide (TPR) repeat protein